MTTIKHNNDNNEQNTQQTKSNTIITCLISLKKQRNLKHNKIKKKKKIIVREPNTTKEKYYTLADNKFQTCIDPRNKKSKKKIEKKNKTKIIIHVYEQ